MTNITSNIRKREIGVSRVGLKGKELFDEIFSYLPILQKIGATEELLDNLARAVMQLNEGKIYLSLTEIFTHRITYNSNTNEVLEEDEREWLNRLTYFLRKFIKDPDYVWSIDNQEGLANTLENAWLEDNSFLDMEDLYDAAMYERYEELEYDGYSTD